MNKDCFVKLENVSLEYDLHLDRTNNIKEFIINFLSGKKYVDKKIEKLKALNKINYEFHTGDKVGIIGFNGAGKSTLLKVISGVLKPTVGNVTVNGNIQPLIEIGAGFDPELTGRENIYLNSYMLGFTKSQIVEKEKEIIEFADLGKFIDTPIKYYSSGMSVRLAFTIATMIEPEILVFDEMLSAGDAAFISKAKKRVDELLDVAKILIIVSHDISLIESMCNKVIVMKDGQMAFSGDVKQGIQFYFELVHKKQTETHI